MSIRGGPQCGEIKIDRRLLFAAFFKPRVEV